MDCGLGSWLPQDFLLFQFHLHHGKKNLNSLERALLRLV